MMAFAELVMGYSVSSWSLPSEITEAATFRPSYLQFNLSPDKENLTQ